MIFPVLSGVRELIFNVRTSCCKPLICSWSKEICSFIPDKAGSTGSFTETEHPVRRMIGNARRKIFFMGMKGEN